MERRLSLAIVCGLLVAVTGVGWVSADGPAPTGLVEDDPAAGTFVRPPKAVVEPRVGPAAAPPGGVRTLGDTCAEAIAIPELPFKVLDGNTSGFADDYDAACPVTSIAPDVVYSFTAQQNMYIDIDLCESSLDTKLYVFEDDCSGAPIACSDDDCGYKGYRSHLVSLPVTADKTYYIVVDGYSDYVGEYILYVSEGVAPPTCPAGGLYFRAVDLSNGHGETSDEDSIWRSYAYITGVTTPFVELNWWGFNEGPAPAGGACDKDPNVGDPNLPDPYERVEITVFEDDNGWPGVPLCGPYYVKPQRTATGFVMDGQPLYQYRALIPGCERGLGTGIGTGWVSIFGLDDEQECWHLWATHGPADPNDPTQQSVQFKRTTGEFKRRDFALSLCLGDQIDPSYWGACCDPLWYECRDNVLATDCIGGSPWATFGYVRHEVGLTCDEMVPPCEPWVGACCYADGTCALRTYLGCEWHVGDLNCSGAAGFDDINPFVDALLEGPEGYAQLYPNCNYYLGDISQDTPPHVGFEDINPFVDLLVHGLGYRETGTWLGPDTTCADCPCVVPCPPGAPAEAETCGDAVNDGCGMSTPGFEVLNLPDPNDPATVICGTVYADGTSFDKDQFVVVVSESQHLSLRVEAEFPVRFGFLKQTTPGVAGCANLTGAFDVAATAAACAPKAVGLCVDPGTYYVAVEPQYVTALPGCPVYTLSLTGAPCGACCLPDGSCRMTSEADCVDVQDGVFQHPLAVCDPNDNPCPQPPSGRCCVGNPPVCHDEVTEYGCFDLGGLFEEGLACDDVPACHVPPGEYCEVAGIITVLPYAGAYDNEDSSADGQEGPCDPYHPPYWMQNDLWWQWTAPAESCYAIVRATPTGYNLVMTVWQGEDCKLDPPDNVVACACSTTGVGNVETIGFETDPNAVYYIQVGDTGTLSGGGPTLLEVECFSHEGACCLVDGSCAADTTPEECLSVLGGTYMGDGIACGDPNYPCPQPSPGDDCVSPIVVNLDPNDPNSLPYVDAGNTTCGRGNDYVNTCLGPYDEGEDIVYRIDVVNPVDVRIRVDPKGNGWSGVALLDSCPDPNALAPCVAWNTDSGGDGLPYGITCVSLEPSHSPYFLVIDSWPPPFCLNSFDLRIEPCASCDVVCDPNAVAEGEPECYDTYNDTYNSGCNDPNRSFIPLAYDQTVCGDAGTFLFDPNDPNSTWRDTDWYEIETTESMKLACGVEAEFPVRAYVFDASAGCPVQSPLLDFEAGPCEPASQTTPCLPAGTYWFLVHPIDFVGVPCGAKYQATVAGVPCGDVYCPARSEACLEYIAGVTVAGDDPNSAYVMNEDRCDHYMDYTNAPIPMTAGESYTLTVVVGGFDPTWADWYIANAWIDAEGDGFEAAEPATVSLEHDGSGVFSGEVVPAASGSFRLRVRLEVTLTQTIGPCGESYYGEVEDYELNVQLAP